MDSDLAWLNGKSGRQSWRYADAFQSSIISEAINHLFYHLWQTIIIGNSIGPHWPYLFNETVDKNVTINRMLLSIVFLRWIKLIIIVG